MTPDPGPIIASVRITPELLHGVHPQIPLALGQLHAPNLQKAIELCDAVSPRRCAAFLGQHLFECGWLRLMVEEVDPENTAPGGPAFGLYEGAERLGNVQPGDGAAFCGHGYNQLTGRKNHREAGNALGLPLETQPLLAAQPEVAARVAAWYWTKYSCNPLADAWDLKGVTRAVNGGLMGFPWRQTASVEALRLLAPEDPILLAA